MSNEQKYLDLIEQYGGNFTPEEFKTRPDVGMTDIQIGFFESFLGFRLWAGFPMLITSAYRPNDNRSHGMGLALDAILFSDWKTEVVPPRRQWLLGTTWPFSGVGIYFDWSFKNKQGENKQAIGLHLDGLTDQTRPVRWLRIEKKVNGNPRKLYYYQSTKNGSFYNKKINETVSLDEVIEQYWQKKKA